MVDSLNSKLVWLPRQGCRFLFFLKKKRTIGQGGIGRGYWLGIFVEGIGWGAGVGGIGWLPSAVLGIS